MGEYRNPDTERIVWHRVGEVCPKEGQKIMLFFKPVLGTEFPIVITKFVPKYGWFRDWCPRPSRWAKMPVGPYISDVDVDLSDEASESVVAI